MNMETPIISPWIFYLAGVCDELKGVSCVLFVIALVVTLVFGIGGHRESNEENRKDFLTITKGAFTLLVVTLSIILFVPSKDTVYKMVVARFVTYERLEQTKDSLDTVFERIVDAAVKAKEAKGK